MNKIPLILTAIAAFSIGVAVGGYAGFNKGQAVVSQNTLQHLAIGIQNNISSLETLHKGETAKAIGSIEFDLDNSLIILHPRTPYPNLNKYTESLLFETVEEARAYRKDHPWTMKQQGQMVPKMVAALFKDNPYRNRR